jgi:hypothetical protein
VTAHSVPVILITATRDALISMGWKSPEGTVMELVCVFPECDDGHEGKPFELLLHGQQHLAAEAAEIRRALRELNTKVGTAMANIEDKLTEVETAQAAEATTLGTLSADETRELADLQAIQDDPDRELTPEQEARFDALTAAITADQAAAQADDDAINAVDPAPVTTPPADGTPVDTTGDGSADAGI